MSNNPDALPQLIGEFRPVDEWQAHMAGIFYGLRASCLHEFYQTFATADYRLAHALAADYYARVKKREQARGEGQGARGRRPEGEATSSLSPRASSPRISRQVKGEVEGKGGQKKSDPQPQPEPQPVLTVMEWGCGNGNLAACFLTHLKHLDKDGVVYPRVRYVLVDNQEAILKAAVAHADLAPHRAQVDVLHADVEEMGGVKDGTVDRILCNELWNDLPTKLMLRKGGEIEEEYIRPNLNEKKHAEIADWTGFIKAFETKDIDALRRFPAFLEDIVWEREYRKIEWKSVPYRKTITEFLKQIDEEVLIPVNLGAFATLKEAKRVLAPDAIGFSSFDAGTGEMMVLNDPEKPCYGQFGGQYSFMVNFALMEAVAKQQSIQTVGVEPQKEFVGRSLGTNLLSLMDLLSTFPHAGSLKPWEQMALVLKTLRTLNERYESPYDRKIDFPFPEGVPPEERETLQTIVRGLKSTGVPDTIAYLKEEELWGSMGSLEEIGYRREVIQTALLAPPQGVDYCHFFFYA